MKSDMKTMLDVALGTRCATGNHFTYRFIKAGDADPGPAAPSKHGMD